MRTASRPGVLVAPRGGHPEVTRMRPQRTTLPRVVRNCEQCGREFRPRPWNVKVGGGRFCSQRCARTPRPATPVALSDGAFAIPLHDRQGSVRGQVILDADDVAWASQWRWYLGSEGYAERVDSRDEHGRTQHHLLHRDLLGLVHGDGLEVDHIDRDRLNCRRSNMRAIPEGKNMQNLPGYGVHSKHRGVTYLKDRQMWWARVRVDGKMRHVGRFKTEEEAAEAARAARAKFMPYAVD